jgi:Tol biopolymer transport system component
VLAYGFLSPMPVPSATSSFQRPISEHFDAFARVVTDGARVYFLERSGSRHNLVQTSTAGGPTNPVAAPFPKTRVFDISPDNTEFLIGNFDAAKLGLPLWIWPVQGGSPVRVGDVIADDASWSANGQRILYARGNDIHLVARDGSGDRLLIHTSGRPFWIRFSPDGRKMIFSVDSVQSDEQTLWEAAADGSNPHLRFPGWSNPPSECCAEWTPDGKYLVFTSSHAGLQNIWAIREKHSFFHWRSPVPAQLTPAAPPIGEAVLTRNGTRAFVVTPWNEVWQFERYDFSSGSFRRFPVLPGAFSMQPSRDGANFAVVKQDWTLWRTKADGGQPLQLTSAPLQMTQPQWSPDGTQIAFEAHTPGQPVRAYIVNAAGGPVQEILPQEGTQGVPAWSPDGTQIAIAVNVFAPDDSKLPKGIYVVDWRTRKGAKVANSDGLTSPAWSPDGKYFIAKTADERAILLFDARRQVWKPIAKGVVLSGLTWSSDSRYLYVQNIADEGQPIYRLHAGDFNRERVASFESAIQEGFEMCALQAGAADGSLIVRLRRSGGQMYALDLKLP